MIILYLLMSVAFCKFSYRARKKDLDENASFTFNIPIQSKQNESDNVIINHE